MSESSGKRRKKVRVSICQVLGRDEREKDAVIAWTLTSGPRPPPPLVLPTKPTPSR